MKQILVATDFSNSAGNAFEYALGMAKELKMEVCAIHSIGPTEGINNNTYNAIFIDDYYNNKREALKEWAAKYTSNVSTILSVIKTPTLIVQHETKFTPQPIITLATDYETRLSAQDMNALNEMVDALKTEKLLVIYVSDKDDNKHLETEEKKLAELLKGSSPEFHYISNSKPLNGIMEFVEKNNTDILCLVKHHHNVIYRLFTRSMVNAVVKKSVKAVLVLHE